MRWMRFGEITEGVAYESVDEHVMRTSATIIMVVGLAAFTSGLMMSYYAVLPYIIGFIMMNFFIGVFFSAKYAPTVVVAKLLNRNKAPLPIGAVQKHFAWILGLGLSSVSFMISILLQSDSSLFELLCALCILCNTVLYFEVVFGVCIGCKVYFLGLHKGWISQPEHVPKCMGESCGVR